MAPARAPCPGAWHPDALGQSGSAACVPCWKGRWCSGSPSAPAEPHRSPWGRGGHSHPLPRRCLGRDFSLAGLGIWGAEGAGGHPGLSRALRSQGSSPGKLGPCGGSRLVRWLPVARHGPAGLRVAKAAWQPRVPGETARDGGQSGGEEPARSAAGGLHHRLPLPTGSAGPGSSRGGEGTSPLPGCRRAPPKLLLGAGQAAAVGRMLVFPG